MHKITHLWAFVCADSDGDEGLPAVYQPQTGMMMPLVGSDLVRVDLLRQQAQMIADKSGQTIELRKFSVCEVIETITPAATERA